MDTDNRKGAAGSTNLSGAPLGLGLDTETTWRLSPQGPDASNHLDPNFSKIVPDYIWPRPTFGSNLSGLRNHLWVYIWGGLQLLATEYKDGELFADVSGATGGSLPGADSDNAD